MKNWSKMSDLEIKKVIYFVPLVLALCIMGYLFLQEEHKQSNEVAFHEIDNASDTFLLTSSETEVYDKLMQKETKAKIEQRNSNQDFPSFDQLEKVKKQSGVLYTKNTKISREDSIIAYYEKKIQDTVNSLMADCNATMQSKRQYQREVQTQRKIEIEKEEESQVEVEGKRRKSGFSSTYQAEVKKPKKSSPTSIRVVVVGNHSVKNNGFIKLRTTGFAQKGDKEIPSGTTIWGVLKVSANTANIEVSGIKLDNGNVLGLSLLAYDELGNKGLYIDSNDNSNLSGEIKEEALDDLVGGLNVGRGLARILTRNKKEESILIPNGLKMMLK